MPPLHLEEHLYEHRARWKLTGMVMQGEEGRGSLPQIHSSSECCWRHGIGVLRRAGTGRVAALPVQPHPLECLRKLIKPVLYFFSGMAQGPMFPCRWPWTCCNYLPSVGKHVLLMLPGMLALLGRFCQAQDPHLWSRDSHPKLLLALHHQSFLCFLLLVYIGRGGISSRPRAAPRFVVLCGRG